ncbi:hypothetical protein ACJMK2_018636, partial [Sinanodonta woodiana]
VETSFRLSFPTLNLTYGPDLASNTSGRFINHAQLFCNDVENLMNNHKDKFPNFKECVVKNFTDNPTRVEWDVVFNDTVPPNTPYLVQELLFKDLPRMQYENSLGVVIGDLIFYDNYTYTDVVFTKEVLNLTKTGDLFNSSTLEFRKKSDLLCND